MWMISDQRVDGFNPPDPDGEGVQDGALSNIV